MQSEFGRRLVRGNAARGTHHGCGNPVLVLGGAVNGRRFLGQWPGLHPETRSPTCGELPVTTDYRQAIGEPLLERMGHADLAAVFPGYAGYGAPGIVRSVGAAASAPAPVASTSASTPVRRASPENREPRVAERLLRLLTCVFGRRAWR